MNLITTGWPADVVDRMSPDQFEAAVNQNNLQYATMGEDGGEVAAVLGAAKLAKTLWGNRSAARTVIGKLADLKNLAAGERTLLDRLPNLGSPKANWAQNSSVLRQELSLGSPIRDASVDGAGKLINNTGFLRAERNLLENRGWTYDPGATMWYPPVGP